jgi:gamma-glutamylputrescine oxidase
VVPPKSAAEPLPDAPKASAEGSRAGTLARTSPWLADVTETAAPLEGEIDVDVAVIGAGFTGLSSALALRREGMSVAVLEAEVAGFGASGRNAGHLTPTIGKDLPTLTRMYGHARVDGLIRFAEASISHVEKLIRDHGIDCSYEPVGNVIAAVSERQHRAIDGAAEAAAKFGVPGQLLEAHDLDRRGLPRAFTRGYLEPHGGILDPGRYVRGLRDAAVAAGAQLFEQSRVTAIEESAPAIVRTTRGRVRCRFVVIATNAYTPLLGRLKHSGIRIQVQLFRTEPLTEDQRKAVDWHGREGVYTAHEILESYRLTADHRILGGSKAIRAGFGRQVLPDTSPRVEAFLEETFRRRFPELPGVKIAQHWGGPIFMSLDFLPVIRRGGKHNHVIHAIAYAGHGVAQASYAGEVVSALIHERSSSGVALYSRRHIPTPPEPFRWLAFQGLTRMFEAMDRRADREAKGRPRVR